MRCAALAVRARAARGRRLRAPAPPVPARTRLAPAARATAACSTLSRLPPQHILPQLGFKPLGEVLSKQGLAVLVLAPVALLTAIVAQSVRAAGARASRSAQATLAYLALKVVLEAAKIFKVALPMPHILEVLPALALAAAVHYVRDAHTPPPPLPPPRNGIAAAAAAAAAAPPTPPRCHLLHPLQDSAHRALKSNMNVLTAVAAAALIALDAFVVSKTGLVAVLSAYLDTANLLHTAVAIVALYTSAVSVARAYAAVTERSTQAHRLLHVAAAVFLLSKSA